MKTINNKLQLLGIFLTIVSLYGSMYLTISNVKYIDQDYTSNQKDLIKKDVLDFHSYIGDRCKTQNISPLPDIVGTYTQGDCNHVMGVQKIFLEHTTSSDYDEALNVLSIYGREPGMPNYFTQYIKRSFDINGWMTLLGIYTLSLAGSLLVSWGILFLLRKWNSKKQ